ncbi:hypothetical protein FGG12_22155 [Cupriavidus campinensis]|uniref:Uncharacterized protein n=1 Tax=Cupriavidus campinensis TaxID=151783 RepID=A0ABY3EIR7_9BURK|nr:hypothetical protein FGG12_22155 [Cupriavidus campinensis]
MIRTSIRRPVAALCLGLLALAGCEQQRGQPGPKPISGATSNATPGDRPAPMAPGASVPSGTPR